MPVKVRAADLPSERDALLDVLRRNLRDFPHAKRFDWLYNRNPVGRGRSWFACQQGTDKVVGVASVFPRALWLGEAVKICGQVGDFAVDSDHRSLGPALALQRATLEPVDQGSFAFCYDCPPHEQGMATFRRLKIEKSCDMHRYALPLRIEGWLQRVLGLRGPLSVPIALAGNWALKSLMRSSPRSDGVDISFHAGSFGEEFSSLDEEVGGSENTIRGRRRSEDLNWRYREDPLNDYRVLVARSAGRLLGFVIYTVSQHAAHIVDVFGKPSPNVALCLLEAAVEDARREGVQSVNVLLSDGNDDGFLQKAHFKHRSSAERVVAYATPGSEARAFLDKGPRWVLHRVDVMA